MSEWLVFIQAIFDMFIRCRENREKSQIAARVHKRGPFMAHAIRRTLRRQGKRGAELREQADEYWETLMGMSSEDVDDLVDEAEEHFVVSQSPTNPTPV